MRIAQLVRNIESAVMGKFLLARILQFFKLDNNRPYVQIPFASPQ